jgi:hypothetical protein
MPEKKQAKRSTPKKKITARQHAEQRMQRQMGGMAQVRSSGSIKEISQGRFPGETPLTGEDRPATAAGGKQRGYRQDRKQQRGDLKATATKPFVGAPPKKRRPKKTMYER